MRYGKYFRACREKCHLTQEELVARMRKEGCPITLARYRLIERGLAEPFLIDAVTMAAILPASLLELVGYSCE